MVALNHSIRHHQHTECPVYASVLITLELILLSPPFPENLSLTTQKPFPTSRFSTSNRFCSVSLHPFITVVMNILVIL